MSDYVNGQDVISLMEIVPKENQCDLFKVNKLLFKACSWIAQHSELIYKLICIQFFFKVRDSELFFIIFKTSEKRPNLCTVTSANFFVLFVCLNFASPSAHHAAVN